MFDTGKLKADQGLLQILRQFDAAIAAHVAWLKRVNRVLVCGDRSNPDDLLADAHQRCKFGRWFHGELAAACGGEAQYRNIVDLHRLMHDAARELLLKHRVGRRIGAGEYDEFCDRTIEFKHEVRSLQSRLISQVCLVDHLTGIWNRHAMYHNLSREYERFARTGHPCCVVLADIDLFKRINDDFDHRTGDQVLQQVALVLTDGLRKSDSLARFGGEEFLLSMPHTGHGPAARVIERVRRKLEKAPLVIRNGRPLSVTASFGIAEMEAEASIEETIDRADQALRRAKAGGRNRTCVWEADGRA